MKQTSSRGIFVLCLAALACACGDDGKKPEARPERDGGRELRVDAGAGDAHDAGPDASGPDDAGTGPKPKPPCLGKTNSPTAGAACGCRRDCDEGETCASEPDASVPSGMCVRECGVDGGASDCPEGSRCGAARALEWEAPTIRGCLARCETASDCRPGFLCSEGSCIPYCTDDVHCPVTGICNEYNGRCGTEPAAGLEGVGVACVERAECRSGLCSNGFTLDSFGACASWCSVLQQNCPDDALCVSLRGDFGGCLKRCETSDECAGDRDCLASESGEGKVCSL